MKPPYLVEAEEEEMKMKIREFFKSKRTWTIIGLGIWSIIQQLMGN